MKALRVPGTTIAVTLIPGFVEIRDRGLVKKKIPVRNRSFDEVLEDLSFFFQGLGKRLAPGILTDTLVEIGVPRAKRIISQDPIKGAMEKEGIEPAAPSEETVTKEEPRASRQLSHPLIRKEESKTTSSTEKSTPTSEDSNLDVQVGKTNIISDEILPDIEEALFTVESLSDSFLTASPEHQQEASKPQIKISIGGVDRIEASNRSTASAPTRVVEEVETGSEVLGSLSIESIQEHTEDAIHGSDELIPVAEEIEKTSNIPTEMETHLRIEGSAIYSESTSEIEPEESEPMLEEISDKPSIEGIQEGSIADIIVTDEELAIEPEKTTDSTMSRTSSIIERKPLGPAKAVILGEDGVGKQSLQEKAELRNEKCEEESDDSYIRSGVYMIDDQRIQIRVWSFDAAAKMRVPRKQFYSDIDVVIVVYAVSDRWSFESIDFWLRESMSSKKELPPIIIVGNKKDLRDSEDPDPLEPPVTTDEGFKMAESLAKKFGTEERVHPVAFIETSCLTGEGVEDVFRTTCEFHATYSD